MFIVVILLLRAFILGIYRKMFFLGHSWICGCSTSNGHRKKKLLRLAVGLEDD